MYTNLTKVNEQYLTPLYQDDIVASSTVHVNELGKKIKQYTLIYKAYLD
ncbi:hypothetical protein [Clostridium cellulovorans]|nr:hypothetical protein [Clostridium cellulovorans]